MNDEENGMRDERSEAGSTDAHYEPLVTSASDAALLDADIAEDVPPKALNASAAIKLPAGTNDGDANAELLRVMKKQLFTTRMIAVFAVLVLVAVCAAGYMVYGRLDAIEARTEAIEEDVYSVYSSVEGLRGELESAAGALASVDYEELKTKAEDIVTELEAFVTDAGEALSSVVEKVDALDVESLNEAISDLGNVVRPLSNFVDKFSH